MGRKFLQEAPPEAVTLHAACRGTDPEIFFQAWTEKVARRICVECPVLLACQRWILDLEAKVPATDRWGVYGALTAAQRTSLLRAQARRAA